MEATEEDDFFLAENPHAIQANHLDPRGFLFINWNWQLEKLENH